MVNKFFFVVLKSRAVFRCQKFQNTNRIFFNLSNCSVVFKIYNSFGKINETLLKSSCGIVC